MKRKTIIRIISIVVLAFSLLFFGYGTMELVRAENPENIEISIPDAVVDRDAMFVSQETAQLIISVSAVSFILGGVALFLSFAFKESSE